MKEQGLRYSTGNHIWIFGVPQCTSLFCFWLFHPSGRWNTTDFAMGRHGESGASDCSTKQQHNHYVWAATLLLKGEDSGRTAVVSDTSTVFFRLKVALVKNAPWRKKKYIYRSHWTLSCIILGKWILQSPRTKNRYLIWKGQLQW